uniref:Forkhead box N4 n=1 Tax=Sinocyclocheilus grahami TaxID=75366 RepID=A0A672PK35_SINGR
MSPSSSFNAVIYSGGRLCVQSILCFCRLLTTDPSQLKDELPGDLQSLSWLTSVDVPRLQQIGPGQPDFASSAQNSLLERQTDLRTTMIKAQKRSKYIGKTVHVTSYENTFCEEYFLLNVNNADYVLGYSPKLWKMVTRAEELLNKLCYAHKKYSRKVSFDKMEEEMQKWKRKDLPAIRRSMANPDELDKLITDRPESCRQKSIETGMTRLPSCPPGPTLPIPAQMQPQPVVTLSLQCLPMHQHLQMQLQNQSRLAPASPAPAQTPPLHTVPDLTNSSHSDFYTVHTDVNSEVDALDPSIMDFTWQGNLWEEMKDDSFNLEALGTLSNSPLRLSDCDLDTGNVTPVSNAGGLPYPDLQVTGLYSSYSAVDALSNQYMNTQGASKPIVLL